MPEYIAKPLWKILAESAFDAERLGAVDVAERNYLSSLTSAQDSFGIYHESSGEALMNVADFYLSQRKLEDAQTFYRKAIDVYDRLFGRENLVAAMIYRVLAEISIALKQQREATRLHARAQKIIDKRRAS
jgi:tetratricopeptide (TPR) repeat protein